MMSLSRGQRWALATKLAMLAGLIVYVHARRVQNGSNT